MNIISVTLLVFWLVLLTGCSPLSALSGLMGGGPSVDAQVGKSNEQTTGVSMTEDRIDGETVTVTKAEKFAHVTATEFIHDERIPLWVWIAMVLGWMLPSPIEIWRGLGNMCNGAIRAIKKNP